MSQHWQKSIGEKDEEYDGNFPQKEHGDGGEDGGELPSKNRECGASADRKEEEEVSNGPMGERILCHFSAL